MKLDSGIPRPIDTKLTVSPIDKPAIPDWHLFQTRARIVNRVLETIGFKAPDGQYYNLKKGEQIIFIRTPDGKNREAFIRKADGSEMPFDVWKNNGKTGPLVEGTQVDSKESEKAGAMAGRIFDNVYKQLRQNLNGDTVEQKAKNFIEEIKILGAMHIDEIEQQKLISTQLLDKLWKRMKEYIISYQTEPRAKKVEADVTRWFKLLTKNTNRLVQSGEVSPLVAKVFLKALPSLNAIGKRGNYYALTKDSNVPVDILAQKHQEYAPIADDFFSKHHGVGNTDEGGFFHFNPYITGEVKNRVYISADVREAPHEVIKRWFSSLEASGLLDKIYFKIPNGMTQRFETIVVFVKDTTTDADLEKVLSEFITKTPQDLLNPRNMPTGLPLQRGVCMAPEPANINKLLKYSNAEKLSYNLTISALTQLSFEIAYAEMSKKQNPTSLGPKALKDEAKKYFVQMIKLVGINPETMIPNSQGGKLPAWAEKISDYMT
ncbi:hypothetical protein CVV38_02430 [Candidatus Peregrinibacteria bacterium HGW-Peregrinibacteria-1]|jgi:hypothetical protein|nr:MAG: hypothetical protein CVV38_02430 [Candidatus Peregrinibacteria bacterium HGW-Peregrinibacteria-1]